METPTPITYAQLRRSGKLKPIPGERDKWMIDPPLRVKVVSANMNSLLNTDGDPQQAVRFEILGRGEDRREVILLQSNLTQGVPLDMVQFA